jgi:iron complex outermembrane recepter protein
MERSLKTAAIAAVASSLFAIAGLSGSPAWGADSTGANAGDSGATLEEIVVTAEKISTDVMHASVAVTAINGDDVVNDHIVSWNDLQNYVPGLTIQVSGGGTTFNIRGVGDAFSNPNIAQGVPVYRDGALVPLGIGDEPLWDLANIQVLRGPQGTLTGANSVGGAIFINEAAPKLDDMSGYALVNAGDYHRLQVQGAVNLPASDVLAFRIGAYIDRRDSFSTNLTPSTFADLGAGIPPISNQTNPGGMDQYAVRASVLFQPTERFSVVGKVDYMQNNTGYFAEKPIVITSTTVNGVTTPCPAAGSYFNAAPQTFSQVPNTCGFSAFAPANPYQIGYALPDSADTELLWRESLEANYRFGDNGPTLRLLGAAQFDTSRNQGENTASEYYTGGSINGSHEHTLTYEADIISPTDQKLQWVGGAFWWRDANQFLFTNPSWTGGPFCNNQYDPSTGTAAAPWCSVPSGGGIFLSGANTKTNYALFGNLQYQLNDQWKFEGGLRETWDVNTNPTWPCSLPNGPICQDGNYNSFHFFNTPNPADPYNITLSNAGFQNWGEESDHLFTYKFAADYNLTTHDFLYAEIATGAKSGGIQNQGNDPACHGGPIPPTGTACFFPEKDTDYEVGYKGSYLDGHVMFQADVFYMKYNEMQVNSRDPVTGFGDIHNAGAANDEGIELTAQANLSGWQLAGNASYTKSSFSLGNIVNQDACSLYAPCNNANNIGQCAPGQPNGGLNPKGIAGCFNYTGGVTINGQFVSFVESVSGIQLPNSPKLQGNVSVAYRFGLTDKDAITPRLDFQYQGSQYGSVFNDPLDQFAARTNFNAYLSWNHAKWQVQAYVTNLSNQVYPIAFNDQSAEIYDNPRQYGVQVRWTSK